MGAIFRYLLVNASFRLLGDDFPWGTLMVNLIGCLLIGILWAASERLPFSEDASLFVFTGVIGAFTTFSTFGLESFVLISNGQWISGLLNVAVSSAGGIALVAVGFVAGRLLLGSAS